MNACPRCRGRGRQVLVIRYEYVQFVECGLCGGWGLCEIGGQG
jgi:hypothetical protein